MIRIQSATGQILQLNDSEIEFELNNWLLADSEDLPGSYSYPLSFPLSENNRKFLQHSHLPESRPRNQAVTVWVNGIMLRKSTLSYKIQKKSASGYLKVDAGELAAKVKGVYLYEAMESEKVYLYEAITEINAVDTRTPAQKQTIVQQRMLDMAKAEPGVYPITFFPVYNPKLQPDELEGVPKYTNHPTINGWFEGNFLIDKDGNYGRPIVPFLYFTYVLKKVCSYFGYTATGSFVNSPEINTWVIYNTQALHSPNIISRDGLFADLRLHVPYITITDFLKFLRDDLALGIFFDSNSLEARFELFDTIRDSNAKPQDLTPFILAGYENDVPDENGYTLTSYEDGNDDLFRDLDPVTTKIKDGQKTLKANVGTLKMYKGSNLDADRMDWLIPEASQKGNLMAGIFFQEKEYFNGAYQHKNEFGFRLLSYKGIQPGSNGKSYPYATSISSNYEQTKVGTISFDAAQQDSIYQKFTVPFYLFMSSARRLGYEALLPLSKAKDMPMYQVYSLKGENQVMIKFLVNQLTFSAPGKNGFLPAKLKVFVLTTPDPTPNLYTGEVFYIEMIISNKWTSTNDGRTVNYQDITLKVWADSAKTVPANPTDLIVRYVATIYADQTQTYDIHTITITGHEYFLPNMITYDSSQNSNIDYGLDFSDNYVVI